MTDSKKLRKLIKENGTTITVLAQKLGLSRQGLTLKIDNVNDFTAPEIVSLCETLRVTSLKERDSIFFAKKVDENETD